MSEHHNCEEIRIMLDAYHDGEADPAEREAVEQHLATCDECRIALGQIRSLSNALTSLSQLNPRRDFADAIGDMISAKTVKVDPQPTHSGPVGGTNVPAGSGAASGEAVIAKPGVSQTKSVPTACQEMQLTLDAYYDNELDKTERAKVENHLNSCHDCRCAVADIGRVVGSLKKLSPIVPKRDFADEFEKVLAQRNKVTMIKRTVTWATAGIAAGVAFMLLSFNHIPGSNNITPNLAAQPQQQFVQPNKQSVTVSPELAQVPPSYEKKSVTSSKAASPELAQVPTIAPQIKEANSANSKQQEASPRSQIANKVDEHVAPEKIHGGAQQETATVAVKPNVAKQQVEQQNDVQIAEAPAVMLNQKGSSDDVVALYDGGQNQAEELGIPTDEDGLYAIKL